MGAVTGRLCPPRQAQDLTRPAAADLARVIAAGSVGWFHLWQQSWVSAGELTFWPRSGAAWVDGMILLSAFCLFLPWANAMAEGRACPACRPVDFYRRRAVRLLPAYYVNLLVSLVLALSRKGWSAHLVRDLAAHLTMTQMLVPDAYIGTELNGVTWTLTVLTLLYLIFPLLARCMFFAPMPTVTVLLGVQLAWRTAVLRLQGQAAYSLLFNQFPAFASTFAIGMTGAVALAYLGRSRRLDGFSARLCCTILGLGAFGLAGAVLRQLSMARDYQAFQLEYRTVLVGCICASLVLLALGLPIPLRRVWALLAEISYSFYLWHQMLAVWLKYDLHLPAWSGELPPNQLGDTVWMHRYNALAWGVALLAAVASTWLVEKPAARWLKKPGGKSQPIASKPKEQYNT